MDAPCVARWARLHDFLAPKSKSAARSAARAIRRGVKALDRHPGIGRPVAEMPTGFRHWFIPFGDTGYMVLYHYEDELVSILAVRHGKEADF